MARTTIELVPTSNKPIQHFDRVNEVVEYLQEQLHETFYIRVKTDYEYTKVVEQIRRQVWDVYHLDNVKRIS